MKFAFLVLIALPAYAKLTPALVRESALKFHPTVHAAIENMRANEEAVRGARGAFDAKITGDYKRQTKDVHKTTLLRSQLEKPLRVANSKIYAGVEQISNPGGFLAPIYHTGNPTTQTGNYQLIGIKASLLQNLITNPALASLRNAKLDSRMAKGDKKLTDWDIGRSGQSAYWEWVTALRVMRAYEELLKNGETRNEYLNTRHQKGDSAQIIVKENEQYVASRKGALMAAKERFLRAEFALSLFYRNEEGEPIVPGASEEFEDYPTPLSSALESVDLATNIDEVMKERPDLKNLSLAVDKTQNDLDLARQDLLPKLDLTTEYFQRTESDHNVNYAAGAIDMPRAYLMVMAQVSIPIEWNLGAGNIAAAKARQMVAKKYQSLGVQTYRLEVEALRQSLKLQLEQVTQSEIEFSRAKELVAAESYKFRSGGGNLFLVNLREEAMASAEASFHESRLAFMTTLLTYQALTKTE